MDPHRDDWAGRGFSKISKEEPVMGWWQSGKGGGIAAITGGPASPDRDEYWGDEPADILDAAIDSIVAAFRDTWGRKPYRSELENGLAFSLGSYEEEDTE